MPTIQERVTPRKRYLLVLFLVLIAGIIIFALLRPTAQQSLTGKRFGNGGPVAVSVAKAEKGDIEIKYQALGTVTPLTNVVVRTQISGYITNIAFQEGQLVQKGDLIAEIDTRPYRLAEAQAEGALMRDQALLSEAELNLTRYKKLLSQDSIAKQQVDTQESLTQQYRGIVKTDQAQIDQAKLNLEYCHITSPVAGRIGLRQIDSGNFAQTNDTNGLVTVTQLQPISVLFSLPEDDLATVMKRLKDGAQLAVTAFDRTRSTKLSEGKLISVDNQIDTTTGTVKLRAQFDNADNSLFPNQFVNVDILVDTLRDATVVPSSAIQHGSPGTYVYLANDDNTVSVRPVKLGPNSGLNTAVLEGLSVGDNIVVDGLDKLKDGSKISIPDKTQGEEKPETKHGHSRSQP